MDRLLCRLLFHVFGHHVCCGRIPKWTAHVGQPWNTYDIAPRNLYNIMWVCQSWVRHRVD